ncbi:hypothetical protein PoB_000847300 [Plakobranchus ocellatus]|uniref:Uncharacterized protein n=1 Tax=Plakobranchus ocellatus TaxID=259542 RepID=A0AAV3YID4_9GAST|nr:hypothetical protein PoB_000847300 [Plakobranchus ocellatus]
MSSPAAMNAGEPANEASVDGFLAPNQDQQSDGGDHEFGYGWAKDEMDRGNSFLFDDDISPPIPIDPRYYEDPTGEGDEECACVLKIFPDICTTPIYNVFSQLAPMMGGVSYCYFSLSNMDPLWFGKAFGGLQGKVSNILWMQAHLGAGIYIFSRRHIRTLPPNRALLYSVLGSVLFNFGSCMVWGLGRALFHAYPNGCRAFGMISSCLLLYVAQDYLQCVDDRCSELD